MAIDPQSLVPATPAAAYSKIRGIRAQPEEKIVEFVGGLFRAAVEAKDDGNWARVEDYLERWESELTGRVSANALRFASAPWATLRRPVRQSRVALISTGGAYIAGEQEPFNTDGDTSLRVIPNDTP